MEELFGESAQANGSLAVDQNTLDVEDDKSESGSDDSYIADEHIENDSDTIPPSSPSVVETIAHISPSVEDTSAHSTPQAVGFSSGMKRKFKRSPVKKHQKDKAKHAKALENDPIAGSIVMLAKSIAASSDPYANLWKRIEDIPFPPRDKVDIASFLSKPEQVFLRNYLNTASDQSFGTWVTDYLGAKYSTSGGYAGEYGSSL
jgi:hypothetical protein